MQEQDPFLFYLTSILSWLIHFSPCLTSLSLKNSFISKFKEVVLVQPLCRNSSEHTGWSGASISHSLSSSLHSNVEQNILLHRGDGFHMANQTHSFLCSPAENRETGQSARGGDWAGHAGTLTRLAANNEFLFSLSREDPMEKEMATHCSILAWKIPWTEEPGWLQSMG